MMFMDMHANLPDGAAVDDVAVAHAGELKIQDQPMHEFPASRDAECSQ